MTETYIWAGSHAYRDHANDRVIEPGEEIPEDSVDRITSAHPHDVEHVTEDDTDDATDSDGEEADNSEFDVEEWLDQGYQKRADAVRAGDVDDHLNTIEDAETSDTVTDAIEERRDELEA